MKVRKAFKKVVALGIGVSMLGATVTGALAANLNEYPNPLFIKDGKFNGVIVIGDTAMPQDTLGAIDVATGLQFSSTTASTGGSDSVTISDGVKIEKSGDTFNVNESIRDVESGFDVSDLPNVLADGLYDESEGNTDNDEDYTQDLKFFDGTAELVLDQDDNDAPAGGLWLRFDRNEDLYNYTLDFDNYLDYDNTSTTTAKNDFETSKIEIQGNLYTFTNVKLSNGKVSELTLQAGDTTVWLEQAQPVTRIIGGEEVEVELVDVNENENKCGILVNGQLEWVDVGSTENTGGVEIGVTDAITVHSEGKDTDVCEINIGASEIKLKNNNEVELNGKQVDGSNAVFRENTAARLDTIAISYKPQDDIYLLPGDTWQDKVLGNFEINFAQISAVTEDIALDVSGDDLTLTFNNKDGKEIVLPFFCGGDCDATTDDVYFGTSADIDERYYFKGGICVGTSSITDCEGARFLVEEGDELHVIELTDFDLNDNETVLKDITYGGSKTTDDMITSSTQPIDLPAGGGSVQLNLDPANNMVTFVGGGSSDSIIAAGEGFKTELDAEIYIEAFVNATTRGGFLANGTTQLNAANVNFTIVVNETDGEVDSTGEGDSRGYINFTMAVDVTDDELNIATPKLTQSAGAAVDTSKSNSDDKIYYSLYGSRVDHDDEDKRSATVSFPEEELAAEIFISPVGANVVTTSVSGAVTIQRIEVGSAKLASNVASLSGQNTIIVGGPCVNQLAAEFLGVTSDTCMEGAPEANTAVISLKEMGDKVAVLVNGYAAADTQRASYVLSNYEDYDLSGSEVVVSGTDYSNIKVSAME